MKAIQRFRDTSSARTIFALLLLAPALAIITTSCGSSGSGPQGPTFKGNTNVTVLLSSTANDQLSEFGLTFNSITLTEKSGKTVTLLAAQSAEFIHLNDTAEPAVSLSIPQGIYTSAIADIGYSYFTCVSLIPSTGTPPGGLLTAIFAYGYMPSSQVTVTLPSPITITGTSIGLLFNMMVSQSASLASCYTPAGSIPTYSITPTFSVTPVSVAPESGLNGEISSVNLGANSFTMVLVDGQTLSINADTSTAYQGITGISALVPG